MENFILGLMVALTPSMILLSLLFWREPSDPPQKT